MSEQKVEYVYIDNNKEAEKAVDYLCGLNLSYYVRKIWNDRNRFIASYIMKIYQIITLSFLLICVSCTPEDKSNYPFNLDFEKISGLEKNFRTYKFFGQKPKKNKN